MLCVVASFALPVAAATEHARADSGAYVPVGADALLLGRPEEGLLVLHSGYRNSPFADADALVWAGATQSDTRADVLVVSVRLHDPHGAYEARLGRFILSTGAVRPVPIDGVALLGRAPSGSSLELFSGLPVVPEFGARAFDWLAGARVGQWLFDEHLGAGVSYVQRRDDGALDNEELGADLSVTPWSWLSLQAVAAFDLVDEGLAQARANALLHTERDHFELFAERRVAARLLPATSLFSVIGTTPSSEFGGDVLWNAFPRLDLGGTLALDALDGTLGYRTAARATLRLSDTAGGALLAEGSRRALGSEAWTGALLGAEWPLRWLRLHATLELVAADHPRDRGTLWPWTRVGASYTMGEHWLFAAGVGARASPEVATAVEALVRVSYHASYRAEVGR
jgi:hypothetical protein